MATPHFYITPPPPFQVYPPFLGKKFVPPPQVTHFLEGPTPIPFNNRGGGFQLCQFMIICLNWYRYYWHLEIKGKSISRAFLKVSFIMLSLKCGHPCVILFSAVKIKLGKNSQFIYWFKIATLNLGLRRTSIFFPIQKEIEK